MNQVYELDGELVYIDSSKRMRKLRILSSARKATSQQLAIALPAYQKLAQKGVANGYASLDGTGKVPTSQLPASSSGGVTISTASVSLPRSDSGSFTISGVGLTVGNRVAVWQDATDDMELDQITASGIVESATTIRVYWWSASVLTAGSRTFAYFVGA